MQIKLTALLSALLLLGVSATEDAPAAAAAAEESAVPIAAEATPYEYLTELKVEVIKSVECPPEERSKLGDSLAVHYIGKFADGGAQFDTSHNRGVPFTFPIGKGNTIKGWEEGLLDMCVGEKRMLYIPYAKAYGEHGRPPVIPAKSDLIFETTLMRINNQTFKKKTPPAGEKKKVEAGKKEEEKKKEEVKEEKKEEAKEENQHEEL